MDNKQFENDDNMRYIDGVGWYNRRDINDTKVIEIENARRNKHLRIYYSKLENAWCDPLSREDVKERWCMTFSTKEEEDAYFEKREAVLRARCHRSFKIVNRNIEEDSN